MKTLQAATTLSKATLDKNKKNSNTLPEDLHYDPDDLFKLFLKPNFVVSLYTCFFFIKGF